MPDYTFKAKLIDQDSFSLNKTHMVNATLTTKKAEQIKNTHKKAA